jgi:radical SAM protein with 4Fe4S-binding SPASM domain
LNADGNKKPEKVFLYGGKSGMKTKVKVELKSLSFMITDCCNLKCGFCSRNASNLNVTYMEPEFIKEQIQEALKWAKNLEIINLSGGEPFMHPEFEKILQIINSFGLNTRINTNGLFFNDKNVDILDKYNVKLFTISLDSHKPEVHDKIRGISGTFDKTVNGIKKCVKKGYKVFIKATIGEDNVDDILELAKFADSLGVYGFSYSRIIPIGRAHHNNDANKNFIKKYLAMGNEVTKYISSSKMELLVDDPLRHIFDCRIKQFMSQKPNLENVWGGCTAGCKFLYVRLDKKVIACTAIEEPCGDLNKESLYEIWHNSKQLEGLRTREFLKGKCGECSKKYLCGGCRAYALATTGDLFGEDTFCQCVNKL